MTEAGLKKYRQRRPSTCSRNDEKTVTPAKSGRRRSCGQGSLNIVGNRARSMGITPPVDIPPGYPQMEHRSQIVRATGCQHPYAYGNPLSYMGKFRLPTEMWSPIHSYIFNLLNNLFSYIFIYSRDVERKLTTAHFFSRITGPSEGHFALM